MRISGYGLATLVAALFVCGAAFAHRYGPPQCDPAPAPLLAAGIPAFIALGGGVTVTKIARRFRGAK